MSSILDSFGDGKKGAATLAFGRISRITSDGVYAVVPSFDPKYDYGPMAVPSTSAVVGDPVLVAFDENKNPWLVSWHGGGVGVSPAEVPIGASVPWIGAGDPADDRFLLADGREVLRASYPAFHDLAADAGYPDGDGNGTTTVNIPDYRGRHPVGPDNMGTAAGAAGRLAANNALGDAGGAETSSGVAAHTHGVGTIAAAGESAHTHGVGTIAAAGEAAHTHGVGTYTVPSGGSGTSGGRSAGHTHSATHDHVLQLSASTGGAVQPARGGGTVSDAGGGGAGSPIKNVSLTTGGESVDHTHSTPAHTHSVSGSSAAGSSHTHSMSGTSAAGSSHTHSMSGTSAAGSSHTHSMSGNTGSTGSASVNIMGPYKVSNWIVRVK